MKIQVIPKSEKARLKKAAEEEKNRRLDNWHFFFALWPRRMISGTWDQALCRWKDGPREHIVWLETVARKRHTGTWVYGPITNVLTK